MRGNEIEVGRGDRYKSARKLQAAIAWRLISAQCKIADTVFVRWLRFRFAKLQIRAGRPPRDFSGGSMSTSRSGDLQRHKGADSRSPYYFRLHCAPFEGRCQMRWECAEKQPHSRTTGVETSLDTARTRVRALHRVYRDRLPCQVISLASNLHLIAVCAASSLKIISRSAGSRRRESFENPNMKEPIRERRAIPASTGSLPFVSSVAPFCRRSRMSSGVV